jgi:hypothetical protein
MEMSDLSQGPGWWVASDGKWYPPQTAPPPPPPPPPPSDAIPGNADLSASAPGMPASGIAKGNEGARILTRLLVSVGVLLTIGGFATWQSGSSSYQACIAANKFLSGSPVTLINCSKTLDNVGLILAFSGIGVLVLALLLRFAERWEH